MSGFSPEISVRLNQPLKGVQLEQMDEDWKFITSPYGVLNI